MKCPNCNTINAKTGKYCRQCGTRLDVLVFREPEAEPKPDEVGLGEELFAVLELFESGDLDAALEKSEKLVLANPSSASAHSIVALVYERKAEYELSEGEADRARDLLKHAVEHYEAIIDLNPDSAADREKLASLRLRQTGQEAPSDTRLSFGADSHPKHRRLDLVGRLKRLPKPALAGIAVLVAVVAMVVAATSLSGVKKKPGAGKPHEKSSVTVTQTEPTGPILKVYTFPQASNAPPTPPPMVPAPTEPRPLVEVKPLKLPKIDQELTLVPEPKTAPGKPEPTSAKQPEKTVDSPKPAPSAPTGGSFLAQAIRFHNQGRTSEAIGAANQAIVLYRADIDAGKNPDVAKRGIANATKLISVWQESTANSSE